MFLFQQLKQKIPSGFTIREREEIVSVTRYCCIEVVFKTRGTRVVEVAPGNFRVEEFYEKPLSAGCVAETFDPRYESDEEVIRRVEEEYSKSGYFLEIIHKYPNRYVDHVNVYVHAKEDVRTEKVLVGSLNDIN